MKDPKQETSSAASAKAQSASAKKVEKVRSSRYEWEAKTEENSVPPKFKTAKSSLMASIVAWLKKFFTGSRDFFDKDDDATPSAA